MATLKQLINKYEKEWTKYGVGAVISYSELLTDLKSCNQDWSEFVKSENVISNDWEGSDYDSR